jgi:dihydroxy-acid dehydratase
MSDNEFIKRQKEEEMKGSEAYKPQSRKREIPSSLKAYAAMVSSADLGAIRLFK